MLMWNDHCYWNLCSKFVVNVNSDFFCVRFSKQETWLNLFRRNFLSFFWKNVFLKKTACPKVNPSNSLECKCVVWNILTYPSRQGSQIIVKAAVSIRRKYYNYTFGGNEWTYTTAWKLKLIYTLFSCYWWISFFVTYLCSSYTFYSIFQMQLVKQQKEITSINPTNFTSIHIKFLI